MICLEPAGYFSSVGSFYEDFSQVPDDTVVALIRDFETRRTDQPSPGSASRERVHAGRRTARNGAAWSARTRGSGIVGLLYPKFAGARYFASLAGPQRNLADREHARPRNPLFTILQLAILQSFYRAGAGAWGL